MLEKELEKLLVELVERAGGLCWKFTSGVRGVPDRICFFPGGKIVFVELKTKRGVLSRLQKYQIRRLDCLGVDVRVLKSVEGVHVFIAEMCSKPQKDFR